jgi:hypothetical protein
LMVIHTLQLLILYADSILKPSWEDKSFSAYCHVPQQLAFFGITWYFATHTIPIFTYTLSFALLWHVTPGTSRHKQ